MSKRNDHERDFETRVRRRLTEATQSVDEDTARRLRQVRRAALAQLDARAPRRRWPVVLAAASVGALALALFLRNDAATDSALTGDLMAQADDLEIMTGDEDLELIEDLEFFEWLEPQGDAG